MAEQVGIDRSFLADVERGKRNISISESGPHRQGVQTLAVPAAVKNCRDILEMLV
jgi:hypothetical protein